LPEQSNVNGLYAEKADALVPAKIKFLYSRRILSAGGPMPPLTHAQVWNALDRLAARAGLSVSGLAKRAGLDPTTFNKSKRITPDGRERWPSTESVAKALDATGTSLGNFVQLTDGGRAQTVPLVPLAQAANPGHFDDRGCPIGSGWDQIGLPAVADEHAYALVISGDALRPVYRDGDVLIVSPAAPVQQGDRVVVRTRDGALMINALTRRGAKTVELQEVNSDAERALPSADVLWIARIVWARQ
jgi:phage repressor protein C with HTH and peptisase S24 domain